MKTLYAPWRHDYVTKKNPKAKNLKNDCVFCQKFADTNDKENLILKRFSHTVVAINSYPYNTGHLMVLPLEHLPSLESTPSLIRSELMEVITASSKLLQESMHCQGMNIGINMGIAGGGGIPAHLHVHLLPRWQGDTNFLTKIGQTNLVCSDFQVIYTQLKELFDALTLPLPY